MVFLWMLACTDQAEDDENRTDDETSQQTEQRLSESDLLFLLEEEKMARDTYLTLGETYALGPFLNIPNSEQSHMDDVLALMLDLGFEDPQLDDTVGVFQNATLAQMYLDFVKQGQVSSTAALTVGMTIEDLDIRDLQDMALMTDAADELTMLSNLECGSRNHMRAFYRQLSGQGGDYVAQYIDQAQMDTIVSSSNESCGQ